MQSSPTRARRPESHGRSKGARRLLVTFSLLLFGILTTIAVAAFLAVVAVFAIYSSDLPPASDLDEIAFIEESVVYARDGTT